MHWRTITRSKWATVALFMLVCMAAFVLAAFFHGVPYISWKFIVHGLPVVAVAGAYYGAISMLDVRSSLAPDDYFNPTEDYPVSRTLICGALAGLGSILWQGWPPSTDGRDWVIMVACVGALLGWIGWRWAKYVDF